MLKKAEKELKERKEEQKAIRNVKHIYIYIYNI